MKNTGAPVKLKGIQFDEAQYPRDHIDQDVVREYAAAMQSGSQFPPITVFQKGSKLYLADGRHRLEATRLLARDEITADIRKGGERDAILFSLAANNEHGQRRSNHDKRKAIWILLADPEWRGWSLNRLAQKCNVSDGLVRTVYQECQAELHLPELEDGERTVERNGTRYNLDTSKIGKRKSKQELDTATKALCEMIDLTSKARTRLTSEKPELIGKLDRISGELEEILGKASGAEFRLSRDLQVPLNVYTRGYRGAIRPTPEFVKKGLCGYAVNVGWNCGHQCTYCSTPSMARTQKIYQDIGITAFRRGYAVVDPRTDRNIAKDIPKLSSDDTVELCTIADAWSPEARKYHLGRKCLEVLLQKTPAQIRILTKNANLREDFDLLKRYPGRVIVGLSTGIPASREDVAAIVEPNASTIKDRLAVLREAHRRGLRTFGMLCPCLPGVADTESALQEMFGAVIACGAETIWLEPVNPRGRALKYTEAALRQAGLTVEADAVAVIRKEAGWSLYASSLVDNAITVAEELGAIDKLKVLLYTDGFTAKHLARLRKIPKGIVWLEKTKKETD